MTNYDFLFVKALQGDLDPHRFRDYSGYLIKGEDIANADVVIVQYPDGSGVVYKDRWTFGSRGINGDDLNLIHQAIGYSDDRSVEAEIRKLKGQLDFAVQDATRLREEAEGTYELLAHFRDDRARLTAVLKEISETFVLGKPHGEGQKVLREIARKVLADE